MSTLILRNARIVDGPGGPGDVTVRDGIITEVGHGDPGVGDEVVDLDGLVLAPRFIDIHTHVEGMSFAALEAGVRSGFETCPEYLDVLELPSGADRFVGRSVGVHHMWDNGRAVRRNGVDTDARPGQVVRSIEEVRS